jgi:hypothetical protein
MKRRLTSPPRQAARALGRRVPRAAEKALSAVLRRKDWQHAAEGHTWVARLERIASQYARDLVFDPTHDVRESCYVSPRPGQDRSLQTLSSV